MYTMTKIEIKKIFLIIILTVIDIPCQKHICARPSIDKIGDLVNFIIRFPCMNVLVEARTTMEKRLSCIARVRGKNGSLARVL